MTLKELTQLAEQSWEGCDGCDENDKNFFINGFIKCYNGLKPDEISDEEIEKEVEERYPIKKGGSMSMPTSFDLNQISKQIGFVSGVM